MSETKLKKYNGNFWDALAGAAKLFEFSITGNGEIRGTIGPGEKCGECGQIERHCDDCSSWSCKRCCPDNCPHCGTPRGAPWSAKEAAMAWVTYCPLTAAYYADTGETVLMNTYDRCASHFGISENGIKITEVSDELIERDLLPAQKEIRRQLLAALGLKHGFPDCSCPDCTGKKRDKYLEVWMDEDGNCHEPTGS